MNSIARVVCIVSCIAAWAGAAPAADDVLKTLRPGHPRLFLVADDWARVKELVQKDPVAGQWFEKLQADAKKMLREKPVVHVLKGPRLLDQSRAALRRITTLAAIYRLTGDKSFAERAKVEMLTAADFADWNPSHFLDVAEMTTAVATGYDWIFDELSPEDRQKIRTAIVDKGLKQSLDIYAKNRWWAAVSHNWNQVCNGGMTVGALAVADEEPELAAKIINYGRVSIVRAMASFAPDGGWVEGPGYWAYATAYNVNYLAALETALGTDFDLRKTPGFRDTGLFRMYSVGPLGKTFNYADAGDGAGKAPQMFWLARTFQQPVYAAQERADVAGRPLIFDLLWYTAAGDKSGIAALPPDAVFRGVDVAFFRGAWHDPLATYVGFKGGSNRANHAHLDLGSFVLDALGTRWALDLGSDDYNMPGYFGKQRWTYYRLRTESHNTLNQATDAHAPLVAFASGKERSYAVADLSAAYHGTAQSVFRGVALLGGRSVLVQDELHAAKPVAVRWNFLTAAKIQAEGTTATLTQGGQTLHVKICQPAGAKFQVIAASAPAPQHQQPDVHNLTIELPEKVTDLQLVVLLTPGTREDAMPKFAPLADWIKAGSMK